MSDKQYRKEKILRALVFKFSFMDLYPGLAGIIDSGLVNFSDTYNKEADLYNSSDIDFIISSAVCCIEENTLNEKEKFFLDLMYY